MSHRQRKTQELGEDTVVVDVDVKFTNSREGLGK